MGLTLSGSQYALGEAPSLKFLSSSNYVDVAGIFHVVGEVQNISPSVLRFVEIVGTFYDSNNGVVATTNTYTNPSDLVPGDKAPFDLTVLSASVPVREIYNYSLKVTSMDQDVSAQPQNKAALSSGSSTIPSESATVSVPLEKVFVDGKIAYFIATDASDAQIGSSLSTALNFKVNYAPVLANASEASRQQGYVFLNGIKGAGPLGPQLVVASALPKDDGYSPLLEINYVKWNANGIKDIRLLKSVDEIMAAEDKGELTIAKSNIVINSPAITLIPP